MTKNETVSRGAFGRAGEGLLSGLMLPECLQFSGGLWFQQTRVPPLTDTAAHTPTH